MAGITGSVLGDFDLFFCSGSCFLKTDIQVITQILPTLRSAPAPACSSAEELAEDISKDIFEARVKIKSATERSPVTKGSMAKPIVLGSFPWIRKNLIGLRDLLKFLLGLLVSRIPIGMIL